jgi:hypothetical protein
VDDAWTLILGELVEVGRLGAGERVMDGTSVEAKRGASGSARAGSARAMRSNASWTGTAPGSGRPRMGRASTG